MSSPNDFDNFFNNLMRKIEKNPSEQYRIIMSELRNTSCPYIRRKIKNIYLDQNN